MLNQKIEEEVEEAHLKREEEKTKGNEDFEGEQEYSIRKRNLDSFQKEMDIAMKKREHRLKHAVKLKDTSMQWDLIAAGVE